MEKKERRRKFLRRNKRNFFNLNIVEYDGDGYEFV
jgi:hypothetical protein